MSEWELKVRRNVFGHKVPFGKLMPGEKFKLRETSKAFWIKVHPRAYCKHNHGVAVPIDANVEYVHIDCTMDVCNTKLVYSVKHGTVFVPKESK